MHQFADRDSYDQHFLGELTRTIEIAMMMTMVVTDVYARFSIVE